MESDELQNIGLTRNEAKIYRELMRRGISTTGPLIRELGLSSSRVYESLQRLIKKGLVAYFIKNNTRYYQAESPDLLLDYVEKMKEQATLAINDFKKIKKEEERASYSAIFEGYHGFKQAFAILLKEARRNEEILTIGFSPIEKNFQVLRNYLKKVDNERVKRKIPMKIIFDIQMKDTIGKDRESEPYTKVRYLPKGYITPAALNIFGDYVVHFVWGEKITAFLIKNKQVNESFRSYFKLLWKIAQSSKLS